MAGSERQRGALVMRELSGLGFDEIGAALGTSAAVARQTVYEARLGLREIETGREMSCDAVAKALSDGDGRVLRRRDIRAHLRACPECRAFRAEIEGRRRDLAALSPLPAVAAAGLLQGIFGGGGAGAGGLGAGIAGGAAKGIAGSTVLKATATVAVVAAIGGAAAGRAHLVNLGVPGGAGGTAQPQRTSPDATPAGGQPSASGEVSAPAAGTGGAKGRGAAPGVAGATGLESRSGASPASGTGAPAAGDELPSAASKGQQTAAANRDKNKSNDSARAQEARATRGPKASHPAHPAKPTRPPHPVKPSSPEHASGKGGSASATGDGSKGSTQKQAAPAEADGAPKLAPGSNGKSSDEPSG